MKGNHKGLIIKSTGLWYKVYEENTRKVYKGRLRGKFKFKTSKLTNRIAVGDYVLFSLEKTNTVIIEEIFPPKNHIIRQSTHRATDKHIIVSNIDLAILIYTLHSPKTSIGFIDRFLVCAASYDIPVLLLFNKSDTWDKKNLREKEYLFKMYKSLGYECMAISCLREENFDLLMKKLLRKKTFIGGHSGVGKSTLLNKIAPHIHQKVAPISSLTGKGLHTTSSAEMFLIQEDTFVIDIPGIKEFGIIDIEKQTLGFLFPEFKIYIPFCKFHNCTHTNEPACAVKDALENRKIYISRYKNYLSMFYNYDNRK